MIWLAVAAVVTIIIVVVLAAVRLGAEYEHRLYSEDWPWEPR